MERSASQEMIINVKRRRKFKGAVRTIQSIQRMKTGKDKTEEDRKKSGKSRCFACCRPVHFESDTTTG
jgi:hypothetical protein